MTDDKVEPAIAVARSLASTQRRFAVFLVSMTMVMGLSRGKLRGAENDDNDRHGTLYLGRVFPSMQ